MNAVDHRLRINRGLVGWAVCAVFAAGCSGRNSDKWRDGLPPATPVKGIVTYDGKPLEQATVVFLAPVPGKSRSLAAVGMTDAAGRFVLRTYRDRDGAIPGHHQVTIHKSITVSPAGQPLAPNEFGDILDTPVVRHLIPQKYSTPDTSGLNAEVAPRGDNNFSFVLEK